MKKIIRLCQDAVVFRYGILIAAAIIYGVAAYVSGGYFHPDEHYQIIEFAGMKLGYSNPAVLPWEYAAQIRPTIQVWLFYVLVSVLRFLSVTDPFTQIFVVRFLTGMLAIAAMCFCIKPFLRSLPGSWQKVLLFLTFLLFFQPYLSVRFSSEALSGVCLLFAVGVLFRRRTSRGWPYLLGVFLGLSFLFRYQSAFVALGVGLWLLVVERERFVDAVKMVLAFLLVCGVGVGVDAWYYGEFTITAYNYFEKNIVEDVASRFGVAPWYYYFDYLREVPVFGVVLLASYLSLIVLKPKSLLVWATLPFLLIHIITPHKEERFLFPLASFSGIIIVLGVRAFVLRMNKLTDSKLCLQIKDVLRLAAVAPSVRKYLWYLVVALVLLLDAAGICLMLANRNNGGAFSAVQFISEMPDRSRITAFTTGEVFPLDINVNFYAGNCGIHRVSMSSLVDFVGNHPGKKLFYVWESDKTEEVAGLIREFRAKQVFKGVPRWVTISGKLLGYDRWGGDFVSVYEFNE